MSTSRAIKRKTKRDDTPLSNWQPMPEKAPSIEREDGPTVARVIAMVGLFLTVLGTLAMFAHVWRRAAAINPDWGLRFATIGLCLLLYHAFVERDLQFRRLYGFVGLGLVIIGVALRLMAFRPASMSMNTFLLYGLPAFTLGLIFVVAVLRNETDIQFRTILLNAIGGVGAVMIVFSAVQGFRDLNFLSTDGVALLILGLLYVCAYIGQQDAGSERAYRASLGVLGIGALGVVVGLVASFWPGSNFFVPRGLIVIGVSLAYLTVGIGMVCDWPIVVLTRRDLAAYFYSPIGYLVFLGMIVVGGFMFGNFANRMIRGGFEPIVGEYIFSIYPVIMQMFILPVLTMRLLSEEKRTATLEVLLTAPVNEITVVTGKFLAAWIFYMMTWLPWWLYLVSMRYVGQESFDYLPVISFTFALGVISAGLLAMGLFFSSLTSNQIIAAVLTFVGVMMHLVFHFLSERYSEEGGAIYEVLRLVNFFDLWLTSLYGIISPRYLMFHLSVAIFFLFASVKMLESRKWN